MTKNFGVAILAGGKGTRLWPLSTADEPKPFVSLGPLGRLYNRTVERAQALNPAFVATVGAPLLERFCGAPGVEFLAEPCARNTAAAVALAAVYSRRKLGEDGGLLILPADHFIRDAAAFAATVRKLAGLCDKRRSLGVMGITPTGPETAYGYIESGLPAGEGFEVARFIEKPDIEGAVKLLRQGNTTWNSGMFYFPVGVLREEMRLYCPEPWNAAQRWLENGAPGSYQALRKVSIDYALMEKSRRVSMVAAAFDWSDVGTFPSLYNILPKDAQGNAGWGPGRVSDCRNCLIVTRRSNTLVRTMSESVVVETEHGLMVSPMKGAAEIREEVESLLNDAGGTDKEKP